uniref:Uncharacterized protein n=2 Tax=Clytia hemisphaerica TaxID=252671 RepID=A0A7M5V6Y4_9CNID
MENLQEKIKSLTKDFEQLQKEVSVAKDYQSSWHSCSQTSTTDVDVTKNTKKAPVNIPLRIETEHSDDWHAIEIKNLEDLLLNKSPKKFFRQQVNLHDIATSLRNKGILRIQNALYRSIFSYSNDIERLILLQETSADPEAYAGTLIGVGKILNQHETISSLETHQDVRVIYLSLSRTNFDLSKVAMNEVDKIKDILSTHICNLRKKAVLPFVAEFYPWCKNFSLPKVTSEEQDRTSCISPPVPWCDMAEEESMLPLNPSHLKNGSSSEPWHKTEYKNLDEITDWVDSEYYFADVNIGVLYESLIRDEPIEIDIDLFEDIDPSVKNTFLIIRKLCSGNSDSPKKSVIGMAEVLEKVEDGHRIKCSFLCLSTPQYVDTPWCDNEMFVNGQQIVHKEDLRIILDEYKLSLRHHKAQPLFDDLFPWDPDAPRRKCTTRSPVRPPSKSFTQKTITFDKTTHDDRSASNKVKEIPPRLNLQNQPRTKLKNSLSPTSKSPKNIKSPGTPTKQHFFQPNKSTNGYAPPPRFTKTQQQKRIFNKSYNNMNPAELPSSTLPYRPLPPLMNLLNFDKTPSSRPWNEIEAQNLTSILESTKAVDIFLCDTCIRFLHQSLRDEKLEISKKNMENLAASSRAKKFLVLRVTEPDSKRYIVGVASANTSNGISRANRKADRYLIAVKYLSLSCPMLRDLTLPSHYDGMEIFPNTSNSFLQQYKFQLTQQHVRPLFKKIFPWNETLSQSPSTENTRGQIPDEKPKKVLDPIFVDTSQIKEKDFINEFENSYTGITFADIQRDIDLHCVQLHTNPPPPEERQRVAPLNVPQSPNAKKEAQLEWAASLQREIFSPLTNTMKQKQNNTRPLSNNNGPPRSRGRGRGLLLAQHASKVTLYH